MTAEAILAQQAAAVPGRVSIVRLDLTRFRNYAAARIETDGRPVVLTGPNGAGKTNLLEAVSFLAPGRGLRRARLAEIDRRGPDGIGEGPWAVAARLETPSGPVMIGTGREPGDETESGRPGRRTVRIDGETVRGQVALARHLNLVWLTPQMDRLFQEGATARRRFIDRLVFGFDPDHAARLVSYEQAMRERGKLLRAGKADRAWLGVLEERMAQEGVAVAASRRAVLERLDRAAQAMAGSIPFPRPLMALAGGIEGWFDAMPALAAEERLRGELASGRRFDADSGGAAVGPHRTDLVVRHGGTGRAAPESSTGEQKALLIAIVLAHAALYSAERGTAPVLLLDEVAAHLDRPRRRALYDLLAGLGSQSWLTGTDSELFEDLGDRAQFMAVSEGGIRETAIRGEGRA